MCYYVYTFYVVSVECVATLRQPCSKIRKYDNWTICVCFDM